MSFAEVIDLSSDDEDDAGPAAGPADVKDFKFFLAPLPFAGGDLLGANLPPPPGCQALVAVKPEVEERRNSPPAAASSSAAGRTPLPPRLCRQFWKSGDYEVRPAADSVSQNSKNRLRINPRFLHSNATSHKWAFGAIAELLDNAIDEVNNGVTSVHVDKFTNPRDGSAALLIQDDGGGMVPESLRRCMSFGFSDKQSDAFIGQYGNGFKTSSMRLGADVIVFTRSEKDRMRTKSVGLLSYTFLRQTGSDDIVVPTVDYQYDVMTASYIKLLRHDHKQFSSNLLILLKWSPFTTETELVKQFDDIGDHGTKIIVFNLWLNDDGNMELDFDSDEKDILITGAHEKAKTNNPDKIKTQNYVATRLRHSLRTYASILYLHVPDNFRIILRGQVVEPHHIANDLMYRECVMYRPQVGGIPGAAVITTIGFIKGAPNVDVHGFNVYHKNRLITPFWKVANNSYGKGRGVVGILEANFIKPTHDKQDFEKSILYQKLENRLKEMTYEYWDLHCHRVGYGNKKIQREPGTTVAHAVQTKLDSVASAPPLQLPAADIPTSTLALATLDASTRMEGLFNNSKSSSQNRTPLKRKHDSLGAAIEAANKLVRNITYRVENRMAQNQRGSKQKRFNEFRTLTVENKKLNEQCLQYKESEKQLILKEQELRAQIAQAKKEYQKLLEELSSLDMKAEKL